MTVDSIKTFRSLAIVVLVAIVGFTAWLIIRPDPPANNGQDTVKVGQRSQDDVVATMLQYCQTTYLDDLQKTAGATIPKDAMSINNYNTALNGDFARISMECHTDAVSDSLESGGFTAYLQYKKKSWVLYKKFTGPPNCKDFDNKGWPRQIVSRCYDNNLGSTRDMR